MQTIHILIRLKRFDSILSFIDKPKYVFVNFYKFSYDILGCIRRKKYIATVIAARLYDDKKYMFYFSIIVFYDIFLINNLYTLVYAVFVIRPNHSLLCGGVVQ